MSDVLPVTLPTIPAITTVIAAPLSAAGPLETAPAELQTVRRAYRLDSVVEAACKAIIAAQAQGQIQEVHFDDEDDLIARLNDTQYRARVSQVTAAVYQANLEQVQEGVETTPNIINVDDFVEFPNGKFLVQVDRAKQPG